ncbi:hypothetical protein MRY87_01850 [bacterium]|nr:hypothetical protein [bacterium]
MAEKNSSDRSPPTILSRLRWRRWSGLKKGLSKSQRTGHELSKEGEALKSLAKLLITFRGVSHITRIQDLRELSETLEYLTGADSEKSFRLVFDAFSHHRHEEDLIPLRDTVFTSRIPKVRLRQTLLRFLRAVRASGSEMHHLTTLFRKLFCSSEGNPSLWQRQVTAPFCRIEESLEPPLERRRPLRAGHLFFQDEIVLPLIPYHRKRSRLIAV